MMAMVVAGGVLGFLMALGGLLLGLPPLVALAIWAGSGPVAALAAAALTVVQIHLGASERPGPRPVRSPHHA